MFAAPAVSLRHILTFIFAIYLPNHVAAATPLPPVLECGADPCTATAGPYYDLSAYDIPFDVNWPAPPNTNRTIRVPDDMTLSQAVGQSGSRIIVSPGSYSGFTVDQDDIWLDFQDGAHITGDVTLGNNQHRTRISGGYWTGGDFTIVGGRDILLENMYRDTSGTNHQVVLNLADANQTWTTPRGTHRLAIINSTYRGQAYFGFVQASNAGPGMGDFSQDFVLANLDLEIRNTSQSLLRLQDVTRAVVVDSRLASTGHHTFRVHRESADVWFAGNQVEGAGSMFSVNSGGDFSLPGNLGALYFVSNQWYRNVQNNLIDRATLGEYPRLQKLVIVDNDIYDQYGGLSTSESGPDDRIEGNRNFPYQAPPPFNGGSTQNY